MKGKNTMHFIGVGHGSDHDLAKQDSTPPRVIFYACRLARGEVPAYLLLDPGYLRRHEARRCADAVRPEGGMMLTPEDLAAYRARERGKHDGDIARAIAEAQKEKS